VSYFRERYPRDDRIQAHLRFHKKMHVPLILWKHQDCTKDHERLMNLNNVIVTESVYTNKLTSIIRVVSTESICKSPVFVFKVYDCKKLVTSINREIDIHSRLSAMNIPSVIKLYGVFIQNQLVIFVMENARMDLFEYMSRTLGKDSTWSESTVKRFLKVFLLPTVAVLHSNNIAHRDIKLENILVNKNMELCLCDFNCSIDIKKELASSYTGTEYYMAPEITKNKDTYSLSCDIYSIGVLTYLLLTKKKPKFEETKNASTSLVFSKPISDQAKDFCLKATAFDPSARPIITELLTHTFLDTTETQLGILPEQ
jgi:serine/threonine protein kinase